VSQDGTCFVLGAFPFHEVALYKLKLDGFHHFKKVTLLLNILLIEHNVDVQQPLKLEF
jgi:hypothetical protein